MHHWQDIVIAAGSLVLIFGLIPSVLGQHKPALSTSIVTTLVLTAFTISYATLQLWFATATTAVTVALWLTLAVQKRQK